MANKPTKIRIDHLLVERGLMENPAKARARIMAGDVIVMDKRVDKAGDKFPPDVEIRVRGNSQPYVSRGGLKLEHALSLWPVPMEDKVCLDVGASTGGFTDVLLRRGAARVYAVDVGYGQLADVIRNDPRVIVMERTHIAHVTSEMLPLSPSIAVIDVSFISLDRVLPHVVKLLKNPAHIFALIKPQFEAGRELIDKGGIVKNPEVHEMVLTNIKNLCEQLGLTVHGIDKSPILGAKGNQEFLLRADRG